METATLSIASIWPFVKIACLLGLAIYIIFAVVVIKQVRIMMETLDIGLEKPIKIIALVHLLSSIATFLFSLFIL